jgi:MFS family permease
MTTTERLAGRPFLIEGEGDNWLVLAAICCASFLAPLNSSMLAVALPDIRAAFGVGVGAATWLVSAYLIAVAVSQPVGGRLGDAIGCRRIILAGLTLLIASSLAAAMAWDYGVLLAMRSLQGISAAMVMPNALAYLRKATAAQRLGSSLGTTGAAVSLGAALGPVVGAGLLIAGSWRLLFLVNVPIALLALALIWLVPVDEGRGRRSIQVDLLSLVALAAAFLGVAVIGTAAKIEQQWLVTASYALLPVAVAAYALEYWVTGNGVVDLRLFTRRAYAAASATTALSNLVMYTMLIAIPIYLADTRDVGDFTIGLLLFLMSVAIALASPAAGRLADRLGARTMVFTGTSVMFAGATVLAAVLPSPPLAVLAIPLMLVGLGLGLATAGQQSAALKSWPGAMAGSASGTLSMMRYVGSVTGTALIAGLVPGHPLSSEFRTLFIVLAAFAAVNVCAASLLPRREWTD